MWRTANDRFCLITSSYNYDRTNVMSSSEIMKSIEVE